MRKAALESLQRDKEAAAKAIADAVAPPVLVYSSKSYRPAEPDYDPATLKRCSHNVDRTRKGKCAPQDICYKLNGVILSYQEANCNGPWQCCITTKPFPAAPAPRTPAPVPSVLPGTVACPIAFMEMDLTPQQKKFCAEQRRAYLAAKKKRISDSVGAQIKPKTSRV
jgi:hypothetical protein